MLQQLQKRIAQPRSPATAHDCWQLQLPLMSLPSAFRYPCLPSFSALAVACSLARRQDMSLINSVLLAAM